MDLADLRSRFGVVLQDPFLFSGTIGGNIRLGTKRIQDEDVEQAAEDVNLADFIRALPKGFDEEVRERGSTLSTGQKQLISFARALAHEPKILILDEATSSVDTETEFRVRDALNRMVEGRTSLIIAHRLSTVQRADKIIVMHKGQVREMGTHQQLLAQRGIYFKLYQLQYKDQELNVARSSALARECRRLQRSRKSPPARTTRLRPYNALLRILISAGEASGEMYGAQLIEALRRRDPQLEFFGVGGDRMRAAGCDTVVDAKDLSVVGITEILSHLPKIYGLFQHLIKEADKRKPDLAIVIDSPAFNWRVARQMKKRGIPVVYYVAPQFWAWRQGRVRLIRDYIDKALVIFPFEEKFYRDRGVDATFVGHPLADLPQPAIDAQRLCRAISSRSRKTLDHAHARQPRQRSSHESADDPRSSRPTRPRLRISASGRTHARPRFPAKHNRQAATSHSSPNPCPRSGTPAPASSPAARRRLRPR